MHGFAKVVPVSQTPRRFELAARLRRAIVWLAPFLVALAGYLYADRQMHPPFTGDEPHYAIEAFSYALDGDRDLTNDYAALDRIVRVTGSVTLQPQAYRFTPDGPLASFHGAGLGLLLAPAAKLGGTVRALQLEMIVIAAIGAQLLFSIMAKLVPRPRWLIWVAWAAVVFSLPLVAYAPRLYPEIPAAVVTLAVVRVLLASHVGAWHVLAASALTATLPWLHIRFGVLAAGLVVAIAVRAWQTRPAATPLAPAAALLVPILASLALLSVSNHATYGTWSVLAQLSATDQMPTTPAVVDRATRGSPTSEAARPAEAAAPAPAPAPDARSPAGFDLGSHVHVGNVVSGMTRATLSSRNGWLPFAPVGFLALAAALALACSRRWWITFGVLVAAAYLAQIASSGVLPGSAPPARFLVAVMPLAAVPLVLVLARVRWARWLFWPLAGVGAVITVFGVTHAPGLVPTVAGQERADIGSASVLLRAWPVVSRELPGPPPSYALDLCRARARAGRCVRGGVWGEDQAGTLVAGRRELGPGEYTVIVTMERSGLAPEEATAAELDVRADGVPIVTQRVAVGDVPVGQGRAFTMPLRVASAQPIETRVTTTGTVPVRVTRLTYDVAADPLTGLGTVRTRVPDAGWVLAWLAGLAALAVALTRSVRAADRRGRG